MYNVLINLIFKIKIKNREPNKLNFFNKIYVQ